MSHSPPPTSLSHMLERLPAVYFRQRLDGTFLHLEGAVEQLFGLKPQALLDDASLLAAATQEMNPGHASLSPAGEANGGSRVFQFRHVGTGELKVIHENRMVALSADKQPAGYEGLWTEHTPWELVEHRLELASWKEIVCCLTQGFTHDLNNALTGLMAMSELLVSQADEKHPFHDAVNVVRQSTFKATDLVRRLNQLLQSAPGKGEFSDAGIILTESLELLQKSIPRRVRVKEEIASEPLPVRADAWRLRLVVLHLVLNALESMPDGGSLYIQAARSQVAPTGVPSVGQLSHGPWVRLSLSDTGPTFNVSPQAFQPWFGTKASQRGSGLGLFVARRFCEQQNAALFVAAQPGLGTTVELWMGEADLNAEEPSHARGARLLLAGQEASQIAQLTALCRANGYSAVVCPHLRSVPRLLAVNPAEFDAVILAGNVGDLKPALQWLRREKLPLRKMVLSDETEIPEADMVISYSDPQTFLRRLNSLLA